MWRPAWLVVWIVTMMWLVTWTTTAHWLAGPFFELGQSVVPFFDPLSNESPPNRPIKNWAHQFNPISHTIHQNDHYALEYIPNFSRKKIQSQVYTEMRYSCLEYTPRGPTTPKIQAFDTFSSLIPEAKEQMFQSTNRTCNINNRSHRFSRSTCFFISSLILPSALFPNKKILRSWYESFFYKFYCISGILILHWQG